MTKAQQEAEAKAKAEQEAKADAEKQEADLNIIDMLELTKKEKKYFRRGWSKHLKGTHVTTPRGESKPVLVTGKHSTAYQPSIDDVMIADWYEIN